MPGPPPSSCLTPSTCVFPHSYSIFFICTSLFPSPPAFSHSLFLSWRMSCHVVPFSSQRMFASCPPCHSMSVVRTAMKNTSRTKCRGLACGGGKPGYKHLCLDCGKRFCPKCVWPSSRHACSSIAPAPEPSSGEQDSLSNKTACIARSEL